MEFRISDTFTESLARLKGDEQKAVKTTAFDLQINPANPGMSFHKLDLVKDKNFWSVRVSSDIRIIVHRTESSLLLCYVNHHDEAYRWAERRKLEIHPQTGAAQLVELRESTREIILPQYIEPEDKPSIKPFLFLGISDTELLSFGVPAEWLNDVQKATEETILELVDHLPGEAAEALLELATGGKPEIAKPANDLKNPFEHPDAQRRFRVMNNLEELERALEYPWEKWTIFLHPSQKQLVEKSFNGPAKVSGSAGTGKTIVALHRAVFSARSYPEARILLTTFSDSLANALSAKLRRLIFNEPRLAERIEILSVNQIGYRLNELFFGRPKIIAKEDIKKIISRIIQQNNESKFSLHFFLTEWEEIIDAWQIDSWEKYRDVKRLGRKTRLPENQRKILWAIFTEVRSALDQDGFITWDYLFNRLAQHFNSTNQHPFDFIIVDEAQDISISQLRFIKALGLVRPDGLFFAGDLGQRIFQQPFSWKALGVDIRGRSKTLRINYRTSHQIRRQADRLLGPEISDVDGNNEIRNDTVSVFNGPLPIIQILDSNEDEAITVGLWIEDHIKEGIQPAEFGIFVRSEAEIDRALTAICNAGIPGKVLDDKVETTKGFVSISTMHLAKGLEFRAVAIMACDDEIVPLQSRIDQVTDDTDLEEVYNTERHLLYVACTRARDFLLVTGVNPASEFLDDLKTVKR